jgi:hypothetical protein
VGEVVEQIVKAMRLFTERLSVIGPMVMAVDRQLAHLLEMTILFLMISKKMPETKKIKYFQK